MPMINQGHLGPGWQENEHLVQKLGWQTVNLPMEVQNAGLNFTALNAGHNPTTIQATIKLLEHLFKAPGRVQSMEACPRGKGPILLIGSGSSLDSVIKDLKDWPGKIICSTSHTSTLIYYGRPPDYTVCMDPRVANVDTELDAPDFGDGVLLGHPSMPYPYVERWLSRARGNLYLARIMEPTYDWYSHHLGSLYPWVNHIMLPMIDSGAAMFSMATWLGYNPIYMIGIDYGGSRFQRFDWDYETETWKPDVVTSGYVAPETVNMGGMTGAGAMTYSSRGSLMSAFMQIANTKYRQRVYNLSPVSALTQFPFQRWEDIRETGEPTVAWTDEVRQKVLDAIEAYLAVWETFMVPTNAGFGQDYQTYVIQNEQLMVQAALAYNRMVRMNMVEYERIEKQFKGTPLLTLMRAGMVSVEAGDLLLRGADEFGDWNWRETREVDLGPVLQQLVGVQYQNNQDWLMAIERAIKMIDNAPEAVRATLLGPVLSRRRWLLEEAAKRGYKKPDKLRVLLTQELVDKLKAEYERNPTDEYLRLKLLAIEQGMVKVGQPLPPHGVYPMPAQATEHPPGGVVVPNEEVEPVTLMPPEKGKA